MLYVDKIWVKKGQLKLQISPKILKLATTLTIKKMVSIEKYILKILDRFPYAYDSYLRAAAKGSSRQFVKQKHFSSNFSTITLTLTILGSNVISN